MSLTFTLVNRTLRGVTRLLCRVQDADLAKVPQRGPLIIVANHVNFLEVPLVYSHLVPRPVTGFAKAETWNNPLMAWLFDLWGAIPIRRGQVDREALRRALAALEQGSILGIAPEGTRSGDGRLQRGHPGVVLLALHSGAPLLPLACFGGERFHDNIRRLQRTDFRIVVGEPFTLDPGGVRLTRAVRQQMTHEIMYRLAALLPPAYRGAYADLEKATERFLRFLDAGRSNLARFRSDTRPRPPALPLAGPQNLPPQRCALAPSDRRGTASATMDLEETWRTQATSRSAATSGRADTGATDTRFT